MKFPIVDTHQHLWDPAQFRYSWMDGFEILKRRCMVEEYQAAADGTNIVETVYVDTDVDESDLGREIAHVFHLAEDPTNRIGGIVPGAKLEKPDFIRPLEKFIGHPKLKGVRRVFHMQPDELMQAPQILASLRSLPQYGLSFDLCVLPRQLPLAAKLVRHCPDVSFILDHCGVPDIKGGALDPWRENLLLLAQEPNVSCKVSGLVAYADPETWTAETLRPYVEHAIACFGWDRVMWGGDWPVCTVATSLRKWRLAALSLTSNATQQQQENFWAGNARRIYRLQ